MAKKKYCRFTLIAEFGEVIKDFEKYADAFKAYHKQEEPKTLYGFDEQDNISVIFSK